MECKVCHSSNFKNIGSDTFCTVCGSQINQYDYHLEYGVGSKKGKTRKTAIKDKTTNKKAVWVNKLNQFQSMMISNAKTLEKELKLNNGFMKETKSAWFKYLHQWEKSMLKVKGCINSINSYSLGEKDTRYKLNKFWAKPIDSQELEMYHTEEKALQKEKDEKDKVKDIYTQRNKKKKVTDDNDIGNYSYSSKIFISNLHKRL